MPTVARNSDLAVLRECQDRRLEREGIPMFLALVDERPGRQLPLPPMRHVDGETVALQLRDLRARLAGSQRDGDLGLVVSLLQTAAYVDFNQSLLP